MPISIGLCDIKTVCIVSSKKFSKIIPKYPVVIEFYKIGNFRAHKNEENVLAFVKKLENEKQNAMLKSSRKSQTWIMCNKLPI